MQDFAMMNDVFATLVPLRSWGSIQDLVDPLPDEFPDCPVTQLEDQDYFDYHDDDDFDEEADYQHEGETGPSPLADRTNSDFESLVPQITFGFDVPLPLVSPNGSVEMVSLVSQTASLEKTPVVNGEVEAPEAVQETPKQTQLEETVRCNNKRASILPAKRDENNALAEEVSLVSQITFGFDVPLPLVSPNGSVEMVSLVSQTASLEKTPVVNGEVEAPEEVQETPKQTQLEETVCCNTEKASVLPAKRDESNALDEEVSPVSQTASLEKTPVINGEVEAPEEVQETQKPTQLEEIICRNKEMASIPPALKEKNQALADALHKEMSILMDTTPVVIGEVEAPEEVQQMPERISMWRKFKKLITPKSRRQYKTRRGTTP